MSLNYYGFRSVIIFFSFLLHGMLCYLFYVIFLLKVMVLHKTQHFTIIYFLKNVLDQQDDASQLVSKLLDKLLKSDKYGERRGAAFGLAGVVKGFGITSLKRCGIAVALREALVDRSVSA